MKDKYCSKCGAEIDENPEYCSKCGNNLKIKEQTKTSGNKNKNSSILSIIRTFLTGVILFFFILLGSINIGVYGRQTISSFLLVISLIFIILKIYEYAIRKDKKKYSFIITMDSIIILIGALLLFIFGTWSLYYDDFTIFISFMLIMLIISLIGFIQSRIV